LASVRAGKRRILVVEDDRKTAAAVKLYLEHAGFAVTAVHDGRHGLDEARESSYDLIVLDLMLPQIDGLSVCRRLRSESETPIVMLTARSTEEDRVHGLELGADDYVTKPFSPRELVARVKAVLRRTLPGETVGPTRFSFGGLSVDVERREVLVQGVPVTLTPTEFDLLLAFVRAPERVFTREELIERALGADYGAFDRTIDAHVMNLRKKIEADRLHPVFIQTVFGVGYKFVGKSDAA
jgi:DNA-binding response OmpR family regulator